MTKAELIDTMLAQHEGMTRRTCTEFIDGLFETIAKTIKKEGRFSVANFGTFVLRKRKARKGRNPQTGEALRIKASKTIGFKVATGLKSKL